MRYVFTICVLAIMGLGLLLAPDRSILIANRLVKEDRLHILSDEERLIFNSFLKALATVGKLDKTFSVNQLYDPESINLYIVRIEDGVQSLLSHGNAGYAARSDVIFIDASYFSFGEQKIFIDTNDPLVKRVVSPLRVQTFFVLAHEIGHRQLHDSLLALNYLGMGYSHARELEADDFAIRVLMSLYGDENRHNIAAIPDPVSSLLGLTSKSLTPLQLLSDHFGYSVAFMSEEIFDGPFPMLSRSSTHPAFFSRMTGILKRLSSEAKTAKDDDAHRSLNMALSISSATSYLSDLRPTEIEFNNAFQYAFIDDINLYVVGNDNSEIAIHPLSELPMGKLVRLRNGVPQRMATIRYAWAGNKADSILLRRNGQLEVVETSTGKSKITRSTTGQFGDNTCVKKIILPPQPAKYVYVFHCVNRVDHVALIDDQANITQLNLKELALSTLFQHGKELSETSAVRIAGFDLNADGAPTLHFRFQESIYSTTLSPDLSILKTVALSLGIKHLPDALQVRGARLTPKALIADGSGRSHFFVGSDLFREFAIYDAETMSTDPIAEIDLTPSANDPRLARNTNIRDSYHLSGNRLIVNLESGGAYLIDFNTKTLAPLNRRGFSEQEQILSNSRGDWILFRKYGKRIMLFKEMNND